MLLTIGVPTYNRSASVSRLLRSLMADLKSLPVKVVIIDDGSDDSTYTDLSNIPFIASQVRLLRNDINLGYPRTFARLFAECDTEYLMIVADDDQVIVENLSLLLDYLTREQPSFVSPQFMRGTTQYRGQDETGPITPAQFLTASAHASGLVYRVQDCTTPLTELEQRVTSRQADALVYPQVVVVVQLLIAARKCEWLAIPTVREGSLEPSGIRDADGNTYWSVESRWQQLKAFDSLLAEYADTDATGVAKQTRDALHRDVYSILGDAMRSESPALGAAFDHGARNASRWFLPKIKSLPVINRIFRKA